MSDAVVIELVRGALVTAAQLALPILVPALVTGLVIAIFQTVTSVQEMSLTFVPKLIVVGLVVALLGSWMLTVLVEWVTPLWEAIPAIL